MSFDLKGAVVKVVRGRNVPKGTTGQVFWVGRDKYAARYGQTKYRIGLKDAAGTVHWTAATNVERIPTIQFLMDRDAASREEVKPTAEESFSWNAFGGDENGDFEDCPESARDEW